MSLRVFLHAITNEAISAERREKNDYHVVSLLAMTDEKLEK
jgi:hypothetical protein